ncbi:MAG TPA: OsmC family protein [Candidatus Thermoplasmatota archaeon]|nr:OsmC family protein [Candidatus Thermoplasmatota archaeon]
MDTEAATAVPLSAVSVSVTMRGHAVVQDKPHASGGADAGPMASELLLAALLACQHSTFVKVAAKRRVAATLRRLDGEMDFKDGAISALRVRLTLATEASDAEVATLLRLTDKACTISQALKVPVEASFARA